MNAVMMSVDELIPYENNPRNNDRAVKPVAESIKRFGFQQPIVVDRNMIIIVGHTRLRAAKSLGMKEVPVVVADELTDEQARAYRIMDNKTSELAVWDVDKLEFEYAKLVKSATVDMSAYEFDIDVDAVLDKLENAERTQSLNDCEELDLDDYDDDTFKYVCPNCGMRFNKGV